MKKLAVVLCVVCVGLGFAFYQTTALQRTRSGASASHPTNATMSSKTSVPKAIESVRTNRVVARADKTEALPGRVATTRTLVDSDAHQSDWLSKHLARLRETLRDPSSRSVLKAQHRMMLVQSNPGVAEHLGLSAEDADRLFDLLAEHQLRLMESNDLTWINGRLNSDALEEVRRNAQELTLTHEVEIAQVLGEENFAKWKAYTNPTGEARVLRQFSVALQAGRVPLNDNQTRQLSMAFATDLPHQEPGGSAKDVQAFSNELDRAEQLNEHTLRAISHILTEEQLKIVHQIQNEKLSMHRENLEILKAQAVQLPADRRSESPTDRLPGSTAEAGFVTLDSP